MIILRRPSKPLARKARRKRNANHLKENEREKRMTRERIISFSKQQSPEISFPFGEKKNERRDSPSYYTNLYNIKNHRPTTKESHTKKKKFSRVSRKEKYKTTSPVFLKESLQQV